MSQIPNILAAAMRDAFDRYERKIRPLREKVFAAQQAHLANPECPKLQRRAEQANLRLHEATTKLERQALERVERIGRKGRASR